jgi:hypothetical protein
VTRDEILKLERYLQRTFRMKDIEVKQRPQTSYQFQMAILDFDLAG